MDKGFDEGVQQVSKAMGSTSLKTSNPKKTARCWCKRAVESGTYVRYRLRPLADSSSASKIFFIFSMYHSSFVQATLIRLIG